MGLYFDSNLHLRQLMKGGTFYTPAWYISLGRTGGDPWRSIRDSWEVPGTATAISSTAWQDEAGADYYRTAISNTETISVVVPAAASVRYWVIRDGLAADKWQFIGAFNDYPLSVAAGDTLRFLPGTLKLGFYI